MNINQKYIELVHNTLLFKGLSVEETAAYLEYLRPIIKAYPKKQTVISYGDKITSFCLLLEGKVSVEREDYWGNKNIVTSIEPGDIFAEVFASVSGATTQANVITLTEASIMFIPVAKILATGKEVPLTQDRIIRNFLSLIATKNLLLSTKISVLSQRSTRDKVLDYFWTLAQKKQSMEITLPFNRQQLADFLAVDRSALSKELSKMQEEGLLTYKKNEIRLIHE